MQTNWAIWKSADWNRYSFLAAAANDGDDEAQNDAAVEDRLQGNICRCTGYRSIYKAFRAGAAAQESVAASPVVDEATALTVSSSVLGHAAPQDPDSALWFNPAALVDVWPLLDTYGTTHRVQLTVGGTSAGIVKYYSGFYSPATRPQVYINLRRVPELNTISVTAASGAEEEQDGWVDVADSADGPGVVFGASVSLSTVIVRLSSLVAEHPNLAPLVRHLHLVAHWQVRDQASWAGNVMVCKAYPAFPSDVCTMMAAAGATVRVGSKAGNAPSVPLETFLKTPLEPSSILTSLHVPFNDGKLLNTYKAMARHANAHAYVNCGMLATKSPNGHSLESVRMVFGGVRDGLVQAPLTSAALVGRPITLDTFKAVLPTFKGEMKIPIPAPDFDPEHDVEDPRYREALAEGFFFKFFLELMPPADRPTKYESATAHYVRPVSQASQHMDHLAPAAEAPLGTAVQKIEGLAQAAGETKYTADLVAFPQVVSATEAVLYGAPVLCTKLKQVVASIDASVALKVAGVVRFISAVDLQTIGAANMIGAYQLFLPAEKASEFVGQYLGLVVATSLAVARRAAMMVAVTYAADPTAPGCAAAVVSIEAALKAGREIIREFPAIDLTVLESSLCAEESFVGTVSGTMATNGQVSLAKPTWILL